MKCFICDRTLEDDQVHYNEEHQDYDPCPTCQQVIDDLLASYEGGQAAASEDSFSESDPLLDEVFPTSYDPFGVDFT